MSVAAIAWAGLGVLAGVGHAAGLWRSAHRPQASAGAALPRLLLVAAVLATSARAGGLLPAATGWGIGLAVTALLLYARKSV